MVWWVFFFCGESLECVLVGVNISFVCVICFVFGGWGEWNILVGGLLGCCCFSDGLSVWIVFSFFILVGFV